MSHRPIRLATRAIILQEGKLLMVNAFPEGVSDLWCAPGGGADPLQSLPEYLAREVYEETGLRIAVGAPCLINEFHAPERGFHQVDLYFRCTITSGTLSDSWEDTEQIVTKRQFFSREELANIRYKPDSLSEIAWGDGMGYDALEPLLR